MRSRAVLWFGLVVVFACGGASRVTDETYKRLRSMTETPVETQSESAHRSQFLEAALNERAFANMTRAEVQQRIGQGDDCSRHSECKRQGFFDDDWYFTMGAQGSNYAPPVLIIGFDQFGRVKRTWNMRTHDD